MKGKSLKSSILRSFAIVIGVIAVAMVLLGIYVIRVDLIERAQKQVDNDLVGARSIYNEQIEDMRRAFDLMLFPQTLGGRKDRMGVDYLYRVAPGEISAIRSEIVREAYKRRKGIGGTRIVGKEELKELGEELLKKVTIPVRDTPKARPTARKVLEEAMAIEYAMPLFDSEGRVTNILVSGKILNRNFDLVDRIHRLVYENKTYDGKPIGTVTIFQDDVRIATNVVDQLGRRAIGTRVSEVVYENVVERGNVWNDEAFVVTDWYLTAYEPIRDVHGNVIGILYVGTLKKPFVDAGRNVFLVFLIIIAVAAALAAFLSILLARTISRPVNDLLKATSQMAAGNLEGRVDAESRVMEMNVLAESFNDMAHKLKQRETRLRQANQELDALNKSYLDLVGFVSHELKAILASTVMNAHAVLEGIFGALNEKQEKAMSSIARNLDYLTSTVRHFLDLSRIEKGELEVNKRELLLKEDVFDPAVSSFLHQAQQKNIEIVNNIDENMKVVGDVELLCVVANNLLSNAIRYGRENGKIILNCKRSDSRIWVQVFNEGMPIAPDQKQKLFKKFSRLDTPESKKVKGTGLGLYITREIIERHGGTIWCEPAKNGNAFIFCIETGM